MDGQQETLDLAGGSRSVRRRGALVALVGIGAAAVVGGGVWTAQSFLARGPQPAEVLPESTIAYVAVDLDPAGGQKLAAAAFVARFPELKKSTGGDSDLRKVVFDAIVGDSPCDDIPYDAVEPWLGDRAAFAIVDADRLEPVLVLETRAADRVERGIAQFDSCFGKAAGHTIEGSWVVLARSDAVAQRVVVDAETAPLAQGADFQSRTGKAGKPGIATVYVAPGAGDALLDAMSEAPELAFVLPTLLSSVDPMGPLVTMLPLMAIEDSADGPFSAEAVPPGEGGFEEKKLPKHRPLTAAEKERLAAIDPDDVYQFFADRYGMDDPAIVMRADDFDALSQEQADAFFWTESKALGETGAVGGPGGDLVGAPGDDLVGDSEEDLAEASDGEMPDAAYIDTPDIPDDLAQALRDFSGLGGVVRFDDGALEVEVVGDYVDYGASAISGGARGDDLFGELPADSAIAWGTGLSDGWATRLVNFAGPFSFGASDARMERAFEKSTGLAVPEDLEALGGDGFAVVTDAGFDPADVFGTGKAPVAARLRGDADRIEAALAKLAAKPLGKRLVWRRDGADVLVGLDRAYLDEVAAGEGLADSDTYRDVLPDAEDAATVLFVDFNAGQWLDDSLSAEERAASKALSALGYSRTLHDGEEHTRLRVTLD